MHRTTVRLNEHLLFEVKAHAVSRRLSLTAVIEEALRMHLARAGGSSHVKRRRVKFPTFKGSGYQPGVESWDDVKRVIDEQDLEKLKRMARQDAARRR